MITLDLSTIVTSVSGPKRPHDRVAVKDMQIDFRACLTNKVNICWQICWNFLVVRQTKPSDGYNIYINWTWFVAQFLLQNFRPLLIHVNCSIEIIRCQFVELCEHSTRNSNCDMILKKYTNHTYYLPRTLNLIFYLSNGNYGCLMSA